MAKCFFVIRIFCESFFSFDIQKSVASWQKASKNEQECFIGISMFFAKFLLAKVDLTSFKKFENYSKRSATFEKNYSVRNFIIF